MKKLSAFFLVLLLAACTAFPATRMPAITATPGLQSTRLPPPSPVTPIPTEVPATSTPATVEVTPTSLPRLEAGSPIALASIYRMDSNIGWGIEKGGSIVRTTDGGFTWQDVTPAQPIYSRGSFFALDANTAWAVQDIFGNNILRTTDGGQSWEQTANPAADSLPVDVYNLYFLDAQTGWYFGERAGHGIDHLNLAGTADGGQTWVRNAAYGAYGFYTDMLIVNEHTLYLSGGIWGDVRDNGRFSVLDYINGAVTPDLEKTSDGGKTWSMVALPSISPVPAELKTLASPNSLMSCRVDSLEFAHPYSQRITAAVSCQVGTEKNGTQRFYDVFHYFSDDGENWHAWQPVPEDNAVDDFISPRIGWRQVSAADNQPCQLQKTIDDGQSWDTLKTTTWCATQLDFVDENRGWALAATGDMTILLHTTDGGKTWEELKPTTGAPPNIVFTKIEMLDEANGWATAYSSSDSDHHYYYLRTVDGGMTWANALPPGDFFLCGNVFTNYYNTIWLVACDNRTGSPRLLRSIDNGQSWITMNISIPYTPGASHLQFDIENKNEGWITTTNIEAENEYIRVYVTHDSGQTWKQISISGPEAVGDSIRLCAICHDSFYYDPHRVIIAYGDMGSKTPSGAVRLRLSTDLGKTWQELKLPLPSAAYADYLVAPETPAFTWWMAGVMPVQLIKANSDGNYTHNLAVYYTDGMGDEWKTGSTVLEKLDGCDIKNVSTWSTVLVGCGNNLYFSEDNEQDWQTSTIIPESQNTTHAHILYLNFNWAILENDDGSTTLWKTTEPGVLKWKLWIEIKPIIKIQTGEKR